MEEVWVSFRLHKWNDMDRLVKTIHGYEKFFVVLETKATREHIQGVVRLNANKKTLPKSLIDNFRKKIKQTQDVNGNKDFSIKQNDGNIKNITYLCKGNGKEKMPNVLMNNILLEGDVRLNHLKYWDVNEELKRSDGKKKWYKIMEQKISEKYMFLTESSEWQRWYMKIILYHDSNDLLLPDDRQIEKMINTYMFKQVEDKEAKSYSMAKKAKERMESRS